MSTGKVTFISLTSAGRKPLCPGAARAVAEADFVIWAGGAAFPDVLRRAAEHADVFINDDGTTHALLPFYDLASRDGFRIAHIRSDIPVQREELVHHLDWCAELGLTTETIGL